MFKFFKRFRKPEIKQPADKYLVVDVEVSFGDCGDCYYAVEKIEKKAILSQELTLTFPDLSRIIMTDVTKLTIGKAYYLPEADRINWKNPIKQGEERPW